MSSQHPHSPLRYVFGPVRSSRLGRSLGLDLLGATVCTQDCLYCESGRTTSLTSRRAPYVPAATLLAELARWKDEVGADLDHVTLGGPGEPTLNSDLAGIIQGAAALFPDTPVAVLTNATTLTSAGVRAELAGAHKVLPSLDTLVESEYMRLNRPWPGLGVEDLARGLDLFGREYDGEIFIEILLVAGVNDSRVNLERIKDFLAGFRPGRGADRVDVMTMTRPGAWHGTQAVDPATLEAWRRELGSFAPGRVLAPAADPGRGDFDLAAAILATLARRPQTAMELALALEADQAAVQAELHRLEGSGQVDSRTHQEAVFYTSTGPGDSA